MKVFDTHAHYDDRAYNGEAAPLIERMLAADVAGFIQVGCSLKRIPTSLAIAGKYENVYASVGIHPHYVNDLPLGYIAQLEEAAKHPKVAAIGECGLDYHYEGYNKDAQIDAFYRQLHLAERLNLPVIVHSRDATQDTMNILREEHARRSLTAVMHCFSGGVETAQELIKMGILLSFTGVLTFKNARKALEVVREIPLDMLMLETDCPYMAPEPFRGKLCDSSMTRKTAEKIAEIKGLTTEKVVEICNDNAQKFFNIKF